MISIGQMMEHKAGKEWIKAFGFVCVSVKGDKFVRRLPVKRVAKKK